MNFGTFYFDSYDTSSYRLPLLLERLFSSLEFVQIKLSTGPLFYLFWVCFGVLKNIVKNGQNMHLGPFFHVQNKLQFRQKWARSCTIWDFFHFHSATEFRGRHCSSVLASRLFLGIVCKEGWLQESICMLPVCFVFSLKWGFAVKYPRHLPGASNKQHTNKNTHTMRKMSLEQKWGIM